MVLLERDAQLQELGALLRRAVHTGCMVMVAGEAGSGKTSLVRHFVYDDRHPARVLIGACDAMSSPRPLGPLFDIVAGLGDQVGRLMRDSERHPALFAAVLDALVTGGPTMLVIEDAHWADEATLDLLRYLGRRLDRTTTLLIVTYRDDEVTTGHPLQMVLGDLATTGLSHRLTMGALSERAVQTLAANAEVDPHELYQRTGGNPFFVTEVLEAGTKSVPPSIRDAVLARAARLSPAGRTALDAAAVVGVRCEPWVLAAFVPDAITAVDACVAAGLLVASDHMIQFRHQLAADAVVEALSLMRRQDLHAQVLKALRGRVSTMADFARLAHHAEASGDAAAVLQFAPEAGRRATALGAHREAAAQYARALRHAAILSKEAYANLLGAWLPEGLATGSMGQSLEACDALIAFARERGDGDDEAKWCSLKASALVSDGRNVEADAAIDLAVSLLEPLPPSPVHAEVWRVKSALCMLNREYSQAIEWGEKAITLAERLNLVAVKAGALNAIGSSRLIGIDVEAGRADLERGLALARQSRNDTQVASILGNLGSGHGEIYHFAQAERYLTEGIAFTRQLDLDGYRWYQTAWLALTRMFQGHWSEAGALAHEVCSAPTADTMSRTMALIALGRVRARRGDPDVWTALDEALELALPTNTLQRLAPVRAARAEAAWLTGRREDATAEARAAFDMAVKYRHPWHIGELGYWRWKTADLAAAPDGTAEPYARQMAGDWRKAARHWSDLGCPYESARALAESGDEQALRDAFSSFDRLGAKPAAAQVTRRLRELGVRSIPRGARPTTRGNPAGLTSREREVLDLVAAGRTNGDIARALYLSPKTVEHHVTSILTKLQVGTRREAGKAATDLEPGSQSGGANRPD